jgi:hypothetical protein
VRLIRRLGKESIVEGDVTTTMVDVEQRMVSNRRWDDELSRVVNYILAHQQARICLC